ncbi:unnamed protein product [Haemonchus placei]|uniref:DEAD domain-containing protein n=1 Tax=Haemonchus placei TaxID=6290 RepID=A0A0N4WMT3_HAEPC|nr:unnamed protein product [Haemonchus placei]
MDEERHPILAIQSATGSGKTVEMLRISAVSDATPEDAASSARNVSIRNGRSIGQGQDEVLDREDSEFYDC